jgi:excisionase family DNA binding protein
MIPTGTLAAIEAVLRSAGAERPAEKEQLAELFRRVVGLDPASPPPEPERTDTILSVREAARILGRSTRTVRHYAATGALRALRTGRTRKLTGIPASSVDAFIAANTEGGGAECAL